MFNLRLLELESELLAKEEAARGLKEFTIECDFLLQLIEREIGIKLAAPVPQDWRGWLTYRRSKESLIVSRGKAFRESGMFGKWRAGIDVPYGMDTMTEYLRGFDVSPPQDIDHLMINFGSGTSTRVFLWYGENVAPYRLIYEEEVSDDPDDPLKEAVVEACVWILTKPRELTLPEFLEKRKKTT